MSQFNTPKNPPWVRSDNFSVPQMTQPAIHQQMLTPQMSQVIQYQQNPGQQTATVYQAQLALQQQALTMQQTMQQNLQQMANSQQIYNPQINAVAAVVGTRNLNAAAFTQPVVTPTSTPTNQVSNASSSTTTGTKQRVFTGIVTKVLDTYGFVDEDVFFQLSVVKGSSPVVHDRVLVEAVCLPNMPFKWNATRIQVLPMNDGLRNNKKNFSISPTLSNERTDYSSAPPFGGNEESRRERDRNKDRKRGRSREKIRNRSPLSSQGDDRRRKERKDRDDRDKEKEREKERERDRSRSLKKSISRQQIIKKYRVRMPEFPLDVSHLSVSELRTRYHTMYIPSDFFRASLTWQEMVSPRQPIEFSKNVQFHILSKEVDKIVDYSDDLEPPDADYLFSAKVMLLSVPPKEVMMKKCMQLTEDLAKDDGRDLVHPSRLINCLVGANIRAKSEIMAIGGPWSPSLDGSDPAGDVSVLIKTAIRTCRTLTGIDLTPCTHWYRFVEIYYHRSKSTHKGKQIPARVETVVIFIPDVWSAIPSCLEWEGLQLSLKKQMDRKLAEAGKDQTEVTSDDEKVERTPTNQKEPTHFSQLDPKVMKVSELRDELEARNMSSKGLRLQLLARLSKVLKTEQEVAEKEKKNNSKEFGDKEKSKEEEKKIKEEKEKKKAEQKNRAIVEERYALPDTPHILVHPSRNAKNGKFTCRVMSLSLLLDYSADVSKEHTFEVSLFAELFNEMLMLDYGMQVYRAILNAPDSEEKDDSENRKEEKKEEKEKKLEKEKSKDEREEKSAEREKRNDKTEEKGSEKEKSEQPSIINGADRKRSHETSDDDDDDDDDDDSLSRSSNSNKKDIKDERRERKKRDSASYYTAYPELLLAFTYFDVTRYGCISKSHLEDLIHTLGLQLSRAQVKKLVNKVTYRDYCDYRKLTDLPLGTNPSEESSQLPLSSLELGNKAQLPVFRLLLDDLDKCPVPAKRSKKSLEENSNDFNTSEGIVYSKSVLVNIENLKEQIKKNETARLKTEEKLLELKEKLEELKEKSKRSADEVKALEKELRMYKCKLTVTTDKLNEQVASSDIYLTALMDIEERLIPILDTDEIKRLIKVRQTIAGAPSINLVPLTKVENITRVDDAEVTSANSLISVKVEKNEETDVQLENQTKNIKMEVL